MRLPCGYAGLCILERNPACHFMGTFGRRSPDSRLEAIHLSPFMRDARAGSRKRHGGFGRNQTFGLAVANDWAWVGSRRR